MAESYLSLPKDLFTTNRPQTDEEWSTLKHFVANSDRQIAIMDKEIEDRINERRKYIEAVAPIRRALSPFRRLPSDVIREIFFACMDRTRNSTLAPNEAPTLLTHISSGLRHLALSTPALWTTIHIPINKYVKGIKYIRGIIKNDLFPCARGVEVWLLRRSGDMPLSISVDELNNRTQMPVKYTNALTDEIIRIMLLCRSRWRDISLGLLSGSSQYFQAIYPHELPLLRSVSFTGTSPPVHIALEKSWMLAAPSLKRLYVDLQRIRHEGDTCQLKVNWERLTHLGIGRFFWSLSPLAIMFTCASILSQTTRLVKLNITVYSEGDHRFSPISIHLPSLQVLEVEELYRPAPSHPGILQMIRAPNLRTLIYSYTHCPSKILSSLPSLVSLLETAQEVKELSLFFSAGLPSREGYCAILGLCTHLTTLHVRHPERIDGNILLPELTLNDRKQALCPYLEAFWCSSALIVAPEILSEFVLCTRGTTSHLSPWKALDIPAIIFDLDNTTYDRDMITQFSNKLKVIQSISARQSFPFNQQVFWDQVKVCSRQASINHFLP